MTDNPRREAVARWLCRYEATAPGIEPSDEYVERNWHEWQFDADELLAAADAAAAVFKAPEPPRRDDWHYDRDGYCDNPGRGY